MRGERKVSRPNLIAVYLPSSLKVNYRKIIWNRRPCWSITLGCWASISPTITTCKTQCWPNYCIIWIQLTLMLLCPALVHHLQMLARRSTNDCAGDNISLVITLPVFWPTSIAFARPPLSCNRNKTLAQRRVNATCSSQEQGVCSTLGQCLQTRLSFVYILTFFRLTSQNDRAVKRPPSW